MYGCEDERNRVNCGKRRMAVDTDFQDAGVPRAMRRLEFAGRAEAWFNRTPRARRIMGSADTPTPRQERWLCR